MPREQARHGILLGVRSLPLALRLLIWLSAFAAVAVVSFALGVLVMRLPPENMPSPLRKAVYGSDSEAALVQARNLINDDYYRKPNRSRLTNSALSAMVKSLNDPYSIYLDPKRYKAYLQDQSSSFEGIGVIITKAKQGLKIQEVYDGSPAQRAKLKKGDVILQADSFKLAGLGATKASGYVRGPAGTEVKLVVQRNKKKFKVGVTRAPVDVPIVVSRMMKTEGKKVAYVALAQFNEQATSQVAVAFQRLAKRGAERFILDLRINPGGLVTEAQGVASLFLKGGVVTSLRGRSVREQIFKASGDPRFGSQKMVVLVSPSTASAAEIVAGALQDYKRATVVGTHSYGKGVFQQVNPLVNGGALDITQGNYFTPKGRNLGGKGTSRGKGILPDVEVKDNPKTKKTNEVLQKALEILSGQDSK